MSEESKNIWKRPLQGWRKITCWFALLAIVVFVTVLCLDFGSGGRKSKIELILPALLITAVLVGLILFIRWLCCWRNFRRFLFVVACLVTLLALILVEENWRGKRAWENYKHELEAKGEKLSLTELIPPPVPDEQNFALTPLLRPVLDYSHTNGLQWRDTNGMARLNAFTEGLSVGKEALKFGDLTKCTFANIDAWRESLRQKTNYTWPVHPGPAGGDILFALRKFDAEYDELSDAAVNRPFSRFPIHYDEEPAWAVLLPHLANLKGLCLMVCLRSVAFMDAGQPAQALADLKLGLRLSASIKDEPILISHLVRLATLQIALQTVREGLVRHIWNDAQLAELQNALASVNLLAEYKVAIRGERGFNISGLDYLRTHGSKGTEFLYMNENGGAQNAKLLARAMALGGIMYHNMITVSQMHEEFNIPAANEKTHRIFPDLTVQADRAVEDLASQRYNPYKFIARMLMPALNRAVQKSGRLQTYLDEAQVACALERYRLANGKLPQTLDALVPQFIKAIPTDVMDGQPLRYRLDDDGGYRIYSIGWNQKDDGGELAWKPKNESAVDINRGDWVWRMPAKLTPELIVPSEDN